MPLVGSILVVGTVQQSGGSFSCDRCHNEINRAWMILCANVGCEHQHTICGPCLTAIQQFACADPEHARRRLRAAAARATPSDHRQP